MRHITTEGDVRFSPGERLILSLVVELARKVFHGDERGLEPFEAVEQALSAGEHGDALGAWLDVEGTPNRIKKEVIAVLRMWDTLELVYERLPEESRESIKARLGEYADLQVSFRGYDDHSETGESEYWGYAQYLLDRGRFGRFKDRGFYMTSQTAPRYRAMLAKFERYNREDRLFIDWVDVIDTTLPEDTRKRYEDALVDMFSERRGQE